MGRMFPNIPRVPAHTGTRKTLYFIRPIRPIRPNYDLRQNVQMNFESLVGHIHQVQDVLQAQAAHAVNLSLTARNWLVGYYIVEFEQHGEDRAKYGDKLINRLAKEINRKGFETRSLHMYRRIYLVYPQLATAILPYLQKNSLNLTGADAFPILQTLSAKLQTSGNQEDGIL